ncbi:hypothetical protein M5K25_020000 [Dendrobium thyrsiflorum]|uniref:Uncharacterized protein n=1 Tax=Dendrobium thyrsiflorum TaxID=117978 RepID=A0ABD0UFJ6_DENTH
MHPSLYSSLNFESPKVHLSLNLHSSDYTGVSGFADYISLGRCSSLSRIRMGENYLNGSILRGLFGLPNLAEVELQDNLLAGGFPDTSKSRISSNLGQLNLLNNRLSGSLPSSIGNFSDVQKLLFNQNLYVGNIPDVNRKSFEKEFRALTEVRHRNTVKLHGYCSIKRGDVRCV